MTEPSISRLLSRIPFRPVVPVLEKWLIHDLGKIFLTFGDGHDPFSTTLNHLNIRYECGPDDQFRIPAKGPVIVVANHPFGFADGAVIGALISRVRTDIRLLGNSMLSAVPPLKPYIIPVDNLGSAGATTSNMAPLRRSLEWLASGGVLVVFPAGEVATVRWPAWGVRDPEWTANVVRLSRRSGATLVPAYFHGANSAAFHLAGLIHPHLRTAMLPHEYLRKAGTRIAVSIGTPIAPNQMPAGDLRKATEYLRARTCILRHRESAARRQWHSQFLVKQQPVAEATDPAEMQREVAQLPPEHCLVRQGNFRVFIARAGRIPAILREIGRLRELTFREAGEGCGSPLDLDAFDAHYAHLFVWAQSTRELVGAYRLAHTESVLRSHGPAGLYTSTLFNLHRTFYIGIGPSLEVGRSFVRAEYQKSYLPLLLLWKGLGHYVARNPQYRNLFGPVSISAEYSEASRALMISYLSGNHGDKQLASLVQPKHRFKARVAGECDPTRVSSLLRNLDDLSGVIAEIEHDHKGLPVLLRHYLNLGGKLLGFSVDHHFSSVLDGLIVVDLANAPRRSVERYMGKDSAQNYLERHGISHGAPNQLQTLDC